MAELLKLGFKYDGGIMKKQRLRKLSAFLKTLPPENFDFGDVVTVFDQEEKCGSICCAIGWTPKVFPKLVMWAKHYSISVKSTTTEKTGYIQVASELFEISEEHAELLFTPNSQRDLGLPSLTEDSKPQEVAEVIDLYIEKFGGKK